MQLKSIIVEKFKRVDTIEIPLSDLNILVGSNGSGKSSILQAVHLASCLMRQAERIRLNGTVMVHINDLDYLPSDEYWRLGHGADWGNSATSPSSKVYFKFEGVDEEEIVAQLEMRSARNAGISVRGELPEQVRAMFRGGETFFSGFIPGVSGIPNTEPKNSKRVVLKACSFGDSNVYLRNALVLLSDDDINQIQEWLNPLLGNVRLSVDFNEETSFNIKAEAEIDGFITPLELLGTGYLQLIQIFCYILLFKPKILLIDEPDIHLHPIVQEQLAKLILRIAREKNIKIIMTTHSPFIIRGAPADTNVVWLADGAVNTNDRTVIELALGWGTFGKKIIVISEDQKTYLLRKLIQQWPEIDRVVTVLPGRGYKNLLTREEAEELRNSLGNKFKILLHRDRDSLTDAEVADLVSSYASDGIHLWFPDQSDLEAEFCSPEFISQLTGMNIIQSQGIIDALLAQHNANIYAQFASQRTSHNQELHKTGGSPSNDQVWQAFQARPLKGAKGKYIYNQLKNIIPNNVFCDGNIESFTNHAPVAVGLKQAIEELLQDNP